MTKAMAHVPCKQAGPFMCLQLQAHCGSDAAAPSESGMLRFGVQGVYKRQQRHERACIPSGSEVPPPERAVIKT
jgi:hypothetical protein